jgi:hypothetical protein
MSGISDARHVPDDNRSEAEGVSEETSSATHDPDHGGPEGVSEETSSATHDPDHGGPAGGGKPPEPGRPMDVRRAISDRSLHVLFADLIDLIVEIAGCQESIGSMLVGVSA